MLSHVGVAGIGAVGEKIIGSVTTLGLSVSWLLANDLMFLAYEVGWIAQKGGGGEIGV
jgi:hypothetical protein